MKNSLISLLLLVLSVSATTISTIYGTIPDYNKQCYFDMDCLN